MHTTEKCCVEDCDLKALSYSDFCGEHVEIKVYIRILNEEFQKNLLQENLNIVSLNIEYPLTVKNIEFTNCYFGDCEILNMSFINCKFTSCDFYDIDLGNIVFENCVFESCEIERASFETIDFKKSLFSNFTSSSLNFIDVEFSNCQINQSKFSNVEIFHTKTTNNTMFLDSVFIDTTFSESNFDNTLFERVDFNATSFTYNNCNGTKFIDITHMFDGGDAFIANNLYGIETNDKYINENKEQNYNSSKYSDRIEYLHYVINSILESQESIYLHVLSGFLEELENKYVPISHIYGTKVNKFYKQIVENAKGNRNIRLLANIISEYGNLPESLLEETNITEHIIPSALPTPKTSNILGLEIKFDIDTQMTFKSISETNLFLAKLVDELEIDHIYVQSIENGSISELINGNLEGIISIAASFFLFTKAVLTIVHTGVETRKIIYDTNLTKEDTKLKQLEQKIKEKDLNKIEKMGSFEHSISYEEKMDIFISILSENEILSAEESQKIKSDLQSKITNSSIEKGIKKVDKQYPIKNIKIIKNSQNK